MWNNKLGVLDQNKEFFGFLDIYPNYSNDNIPTVATVKVLAKGKAFSAGAEIAIVTSVTDVHTVMVTPGTATSTLVQV